ncbi:MAG: DUF3043 domain-containing protein [Actinomycetota bacterium]
MSEEKKNKPTPKRNEKKVTPALAPAATKEAKKAERENARRRRMEMRELYMKGDERALPKRDKGPVKKFARDYVDSRWSIAEFFLPLLMVVLLLTALPNVTVKILATLLMYIVVLISVLDGIWMGRQIKKHCASKFPNESAKGVSMYAWMRSTQIRRLRTPAPQVDRGTKLING